MNIQEKNILILERVFGYEKHTWTRLGRDREYPYWKRGDICYTLGHDFYPSPTDANYHVNDAFQSLSDVGPLLDWLSRKTIFMISSHYDIWLGIVHRGDGSPSYLSNKNQVELVVDMVVEYLRKEEKSVD